MAHSILILLHAGLAVASFVLGCLLLAAVPDSARSGRFAAFFWCTAAAMTCLIVVVLIDWPGLPVTKRIAFAVLAVLAVYLIVRAVQAWRTLVRMPDRWRRSFIGHVGFVLISLFDGFCIVAAIDLGMPPPVTITVAVLGVVVGVLLLRALVRRDAARHPVQAF
ncbi:hypothetical protein [Leifsonia sp. NPDC077715]|uniref:hypothetical protein n=1 Tax=Leifsonia sp. NPDC077715 TaxID=3155539 RepID=UPI003435118E